MIQYKEGETDIQGVDFVKKEYKGKMEAMKKHKDIEN